MTDIFSKRKRSEIMSRVKSKNTGPERMFFQLAKDFWREGFRYVKHSRKIYGIPDLAFTKRKVAVFIDSEFWHGKDFNRWKDNMSSYWKNKISRNILRDKQVNRTLKSQGWKVVRIWTKNMKKNHEKEMKKIRIALNS